MSGHSFMASFVSQETYLNTLCWPPLWKKTSLTITFATKALRMTIFAIYIYVFEVKESDGVICLV